MPVSSGDTLRGTICLYWDSVITYREDLVRQVQQLADTLGKHLPRFSPRSADAAPAPA
ncbi:hypothetical protein BJY24_005563 [Nocardia transvalensis]|uniref:Uncharacterized protein n=1 Tax=Nocardia transvalensis TaxID=37333 RepID=A0A7W9UKM9_9NOCA|nr:hypothetical protein [Nocardia transvalensis]MBB5916651.1 hypothetical protein [Nocardia transvalensis]